MKNKIAVIFILIFMLLCVPCLVSLADSESSSSQSSHSSVSSSVSSEEEDESTGASVGGTDSDTDSDESDDNSDSSSDSSDSSSDSESSSSQSSSSSSSSKGYRFSGDPVQGETPQFSALKLGDCDPDDGEDFELEPEENDEYKEVTIRNTDAEDMDGNDNFYIDFEDCKFWLPIEIPARNVIDDNINSKLIVSFGGVPSSVINKVTSSTVKSSHILQTFTLSITKYDKKGQASVMNSFDGTVKFIYSVNSAVINQYNRDGKIALLFYDTKNLSLTPIEYTLNAEKSTLTAYPSNSGTFFIVNSNDLDISTAVKLNSAPPIGKLLIYIGTFLSLAAAVTFAVILAVKNKREKAPHPTTKKR